MHGPTKINNEAGPTWKSLRLATALDLKFRMEQLSSYVFSAYFLLSFGKFCLWVDSQILNDFLMDRKKMAELLTELLLHPAKTLVTFRLESLLARMAPQLSMRIGSTR